MQKHVAGGTLPDELAEASGTHNLLGYRDLRLSADDLLYLRCANGGGYGDPLEREPQSVAQDVVDGLVSREAAESIYGIVFSEGDGVDDAGTREKRESLKRERQAAVTRAAAVAEPPVTGTGAVRHPLQESLVLSELGERTWVQCARCSHILCESDGDWREACSLGAAPPTEAGPLMDLLVDQYEFQRWYCPGCGVLLDSEIAAAEARTG